MPKYRGTYRDYLYSRYWRAIRRRALIAARYCCNRCGQTSALEVHHRTYERLGCEIPADLEVLCDTCHRRHHGRPDPDTESCGGEPEIVSTVTRRIMDWLHQYQPEAV
jgi:5-methylcytosine-specific restriction endonuclease McrA